MRAWMERVILDPQLGSRIKLGLDGPDRLGCQVVFRCREVNQIGAMNDPRSNVLLLGRVLERGDLIGIAIRN